MVRRLWLSVAAILGKAALWLGLVLCPVSASSGVAQVLALNQAQATILVSGATKQETLQLPFHWDRANPGQQGEAFFDFRFDLPVAPQGLWGIYLPRLGNAYEIWLNGTLLQHGGDLTAYDGADFARVPRYISVDHGHFQLSNHLQIHIRADRGRRGGLAPPVIGPEDLVYPLYSTNYHWRATGSIAVMAFCFVVGLTALALSTAAAMRTPTDHARLDPLFIFAAVAQLFWALYVADVLIEDPPLPWPWWGVVQVVALGIWGCSMALACMETTRWSAHRLAHWFRRWLAVLMVLCPVMAWWALGRAHPLALTVWYALFGVSMLAFVLAFLGSAVKQSSLEQLVVAAVALINIAVGVRDFFVFRIDTTYGNNTWSRYSSVLFGLALGYVVLTRFRATSVQLHDLLGTLGARVSEKEAALRETFEKLEILARQQERTAERTRILRNMHDGVGAHISSAIRQLQSTPDSNLAQGRDEVLLTLRDALDQLKLSIDSIHLVPGDVTAMLANLRYRLGSRFAAMGIELQWDVDLLPLCMRIDSSAMGELQFILFEALSNVLQHSHAKILRLEGHAHKDGADPTRIFVRMVDDGVGFDPAGTPRTGLAAMRQRADSIGVTLKISSKPGQTVVEIQIGG